MAIERGDIRDFGAQLDLDAVGRFVDLVGYYAEGFKSGLVPYSWQSRQLEQLLAGLNPDNLPQDVTKRVNYYNKLDRQVSLGNDIAVMDLPRKQSRYFYDLMTVAKPFGPDRRLAYLFGDIKKIPDTPTIVKSRPIAGNNNNSVLMNLNKFRHFRFAKDRVPFEEKSPTAVWRGRLCNQMRLTLAQKFEAHPSFDIGYTTKGSRIGFERHDVAPKPSLSVVQQCQHRYIISIEGNDVATNLKWIMSSNSLCLSPVLKYETWFMEGKLQPGVHFAEISRDFEDLEDTIAYYEAHPDEARAIIANAKAYRNQFLDKNREKLIALLVLQKYFECSGQVEPRLFAP